MEPEFKNILGYELGARVGSIDEKSRAKKYRATVPLRENLNSRSGRQLLFYIFFLE
jgi:hypothetical protein